MTYLLQNAPFAYDDKALSARCYSSLVVELCDASHLMCAPISGVTSTSLNERFGLRSGVMYGAFALRAGCLRFCLSDPLSCISLFHAWDNMGVSSLLTLRDSRYLCHSANCPLRFQLIPFHRRKPPFCNATCYTLAYPGTSPQRYV